MEKEYKHVHAYKCTTEQIDQLRRIPAFHKTGFRIELLRPAEIVNGTDHNDGTDGEIFYYLTINGVIIETGNIFDILRSVQTLLKLYGSVYPNDQSEKTAKK